MRIFFSIHLLLVVVLLAGGLYLGQSIQQKDATKKEAEMKRLVGSVEYKKFPEIIQLKEKTVHQAKRLPQQQEIENKLNSVLLKLDQEYTGKLKVLVAQGKQEYSAIKVKGEKGATDAFIKKYLGLLKALEKECDVRVYAALLLTENELKSYGYATNYIPEAKEHYLKMKQERRSQLIR